ncbi:MAG: helix-turn-helix transcriptional regulator [Pseudomonadota bacterium]
MPLSPSIYEENRWAKFREIYMQQLEQKAEDRFIRLPELMYITGRKRSTIYRDIKEGNFPKQFKLGNSRSVGWLSTEVYRWLQNQDRA